MNKPEPSLRNTVISAVAAVGGLVIMVIVAAILYLPERADTVARPGMSAVERRELLQEKLNRDQEELGHYGWINEDSGRVRLPIEYAMQLAVNEINEDGAILVREFEEPEEEEPEEDNGEEEPEEDTGDEEPEEETGDETDDVDDVDEEPENNYSED